ncbi:hypothetical protein ACFQVC_33045 [Streptomyces monticola]|uniref:Uncharacterized protein n=1 Tax=Streptomyces monticola TaxID=2666263 RepID=A0ABW2JSU6_9ACTN
MDQFHGYAPSRRAAPAAAEGAAPGLAASPTAAIEAVERLDAAQKGPAVTGAGTDGA